MDDRKTIARRSTRTFEAESATVAYTEKMAVLDTTMARKDAVSQDDARESERGLAKHSRSSSSSTVSGPSAETSKNINMTVDDMYYGASEVIYHSLDSRTQVVGTDKRDELNFGMVLPKLFRSACPEPEDHTYLKSLGLKTVLSLADKERPDSYRVFMEENGIKHIVIDMAGTKKVAIPLHTMRIILGVAMDRNNYPMLIHCNHGRHRTGCVVAIMRKVARSMTLNAILDEYRHYAGEKARECDLKYISAFNIADVDDILENINYTKTSRTNASLHTDIWLHDTKMGRFLIMVVFFLLFCWINIVWFTG